MIYLAPLQGFTDFVYRKVCHQVVTGVDAFFIPYITLKSNAILAKYRKEILPENNAQERVVPQILAQSGSELVRLAQILSDMGYSEVNLNMGCPYPMVTNRGKGAGLLPHPDRIDQILNEYFGSSKLKLSIKLRTGLDSATELGKIIPVLNKYPLKEVILHPRIAKQLYSGEIDTEAFKLAVESMEHELAFNGDILCKNDFKYRQMQFPGIGKWMIGRGILMNTLLPLELKGISLSEQERREKLMEFHALMLDNYLGLMDNEGNALNKMQQFWIYFSHNFPKQKKVLKSIKKSKTLIRYRPVVQQVFNY